MCTFSFDDYIHVSSMMTFLHPTRNANVVSLFDRYIPFFLSNQLQNIGPYSSILANGTFKNSMILISLGFLSCASCLFLLFHDAMCIFSSRIYNRRVSFFGIHTSPFNKITPSCDWLVYQLNNSLLAKPSIAKIMTDHVYHVPFSVLILFSKDRRNFSNNKHCCVVCHSYNWHC